MVIALKQISKFILSQNLKEDTLSDYLNNKLMALMN